MTYKDCTHYCDGYCLKETDGFGFNHECIRRGDCPEVATKIARERLEKIASFRKGKNEPERT